MLFSIRSVLWVSVGVVSWLLPRAVGFASLPACLWTVLARAPSQPARRFVPHSRACGSCCSASPAGLAPVPFARDSRSPSRALLHDVWRSACWLRCPWCPTAAASRMWPRLILDLHPIIIVCSPGRSIRAPAGVPCPHLRPRQRCLRFIPALAGIMPTPRVDDPPRIDVGAIATSPNGTTRTRRHPRPRHAYTCTPDANAKRGRSRAFVLPRR